MLQKYVYMLYIVHIIIIIWLKCLIVQKHTDVIEMRDCIKTHVFDQE